MRKITERPGGSIMPVEVVRASLLTMDPDDVVIRSVRVPVVESNDTVSEPDWACVGSISTVLWDSISVTQSV